MVVGQFEFLMASSLVDGVIPSTGSGQALRVCDFIEFEKKSALKASELSVEKTRKIKKVTNSQDDRVEFYCELAGHGTGTLRKTPVPAVLRTARG